MAAALSLTAAATPGCVHDLSVSGPLGPAPAPRAPEVRVLVFGDFGYRTLPQALAARGMRGAARALPFDLALELGDNVYFCGPDPSAPGADACRFEADGATVAPGPPPPADPRFDDAERPLAGLAARGGGPLPVFLALGNHDVASDGRCAVPGLARADAERRRACLEVAHHGPAWTMPARHYVVDRGPLRIVVIDTNVLPGDYGGFTLEQELAFVREATAPCADGRLCVLAGHHPPAAAHGYPVRAWRGPTVLQARMARLLAAAGGHVQAFFGGHVHLLEQLTLDGLDVFVSGSTAMGSFMRLRTTSPARAAVRFATNDWGWAELEVDRQGWGVTFRDWRGEALHCCAADGRGPCLPVECR